MKPSLSRKLLVPILLLITVGLVTTLAVTYFSARQATLAESGQRLQRETRLAAQLIDNWFQARQVDLSLWAQEESLIDLVRDNAYVENRGGKAGRFLATQHGAHPYLEGIFVADARGNVLAFSTQAAQPLVTIHLKDRLYFVETLSGKQVFSPLILSKISGNPVFVVTAPLKVGENIKGVIGGVVNFAAFSRLFIENFKAQENRSVFLGDTRGNILTGARLELATLPPSLVEGVAAAPLQVERLSLDNQEQLLCGQRLTYTNWFIAISRPVDAVLQRINKAGQLSALLAALVLASISFVVLHLFHRQLNIRIQAITRVMGLVKQGDLSCRIDQLPGQADELGDLAGSFNRMVSQLEGTISLLNREIQMRKDSEEILSYHQQNLETIIAERSRALEEEIIGRKMMEERLARSEKLEMIGTLAGGVAHDLNNILSGIVTYPDLLLLKLPEDSPCIGPLHTIKRTGERAAAIVQDLLSLSGHRCLKKVPLVLKDLLDGCLASKEYRELLAEFPHLTLRCEVAADLPPIMGAAGALSMALLHLLSFAARMTEKEGGEVAFFAQERTLLQPLQAYEQIEAGHYCVLTMRYSGRSLAPEHQARIFEPFYTSKKLRLPGTGLEMAVILGTIKDHHGSIDLNIEDQGNACFSLYFPCNHHTGEEDAANRKK
nr:cache domain-containing protein [uncultured Desulfobulbus sp.]